MRRLVAGSESSLLKSFEFRSSCECRVRLELDFSKRSCEVSEAYSCLTLEVNSHPGLNLSGLNWMTNRVANRQATTKFDKQLQRG